MADRVDGGVDAGAVLGPEAHEPASEEMPLEDLAVQGVNPFEHHPRSRLQFLPRVHQRLPDFAPGGVRRVSDTRLTPV